MSSSASGRRVSTLRSVLHTSSDGRRFSIHPEDEGSSQSHQNLRAHQAHRVHAGLDPNRASTGVIWYVAPKDRSIAANTNCTQGN